MASSLLTTSMHDVEELDISLSTFNSIIRNRLGMRKVSARWVLHHLTTDQVQWRLTVATNLLSRFETEKKKNFISRVVAWLDHMKRQATESHTPNSPRPVKFRRKQGKLKMLIIFAFDIRGVLTSHRVEPGQNVNGMHYKDLYSKGIATCCP